MVYSWRVNFKLCLAVTHLVNNDLGYRLVSRKKPHTAKLKRGRPDHNVLKFSCKYFENVTRLISEEVSQKLS